MIDLETLRVFAEVVLLDLVLAGDNAIIVGMVASRVPADIRKQVILWGIGAAVVMRIGFSLVAIQLLRHVRRVCPDTSSSKPREEQDHQPVLIR